MAKTNRKNEINDHWLKPLHCLFWTLFLFTSRVPSDWRGRGEVLHSLFYQHYSRKTEYLSSDIDYDFPDTLSTSPRLLFFPVRLNCGWTECSPGPGHSINTILPLLKALTLNQKIAAVSSRKIQSGLSIPYYIPDLSTRNAVTFLFPDHLWKLSVVLKGCSVLSRGEVRGMTCE